MEKMFYDAKSGGFSVMIERLFVCNYLRYQILIFFLRIMLNLY